MLAFQLDVRFGKDQRTWPQVFGFASSWCTCCSTKPSRPEHSFEALRFYHVLFSGVLRRGVGFVGKSPSVLLAPLPVHWQSKIWSEGRRRLWKKLVDGSRSWVQKACGRCWHSWHCCTQTQPLARSVPSHSAPSLQRLWGMPPLCCFVSLFGHRSKDGKP